ncbi:hypothetical protein GOP47_0016049, partial [Adiantum capillus-veneris]
PNDILGVHEGGLEFGEGGIIHIEGLGEDGSRDAGAKEGGGKGNSAGGGAAEGGNGHGGFGGGGVDLEVDEALGENEEVATLQGLAEEIAGCVDKADHEAAVQQEEELRGAGVRVGGVLRARLELQQSGRYAQPGQRRKGLGRHLQRLKRARRRLRPLP